MQLLSVVLISTESVALQVHSLLCLLTCNLLKLAKSQKMFMKSYSLALAFTILLANCAYSVFFFNYF